MEGRWTLFLCVLELLLVACDAQNDSTDTVNARHLIGTNLAMYILIGIAGLYFAITIICFCIILCICCCNCKRSRPRRPDEIQLHPREHKPGKDQLQKEGQVQAGDSMRREPNQYKYQELTETPVSPTATSILDIEKAPSVKQMTPRFKRRQCESEGAATPTVHPHGAPHRDDEMATPTLRPHGSPRPSSRPQSGKIEASPHSKTQLVEDAVTPSISFPTGVPPVALAPVYKTPNLRRTSPRFTRRQAGDTRTLTPTGSPWISAKFSPLPPSRPTPGAVNPGYREESVTLLALLKELSTISHKWFQVGVHFQIPLRTLNAIKRIVDENDELCMMRVCEEWVWKEGDPTWSAVVRMLESKVISEKALANSLKDKYCTELQLPDEVPPSSPKLDTSTTWI